MPKVISRKTSHVKSAGFTQYEGDDPRPGRAYRAVINKCVAKMSSSGNLMVQCVVELRAKPGSDLTKYDGWVGFPFIVLTDKEANIAKEQTFYVAVCGKEDAAIKTAGDPTKFKPGDGQETPVISVGGQKPVGKTVLVRLVKETSEDYGDQIKANQIYRVRDADAVEPEDTEEELPEDSEEEETEEPDGYSEEDLKGKSVAALRKILMDEFDIPEETAKGMKSKAGLISEILDQQTDAAADEDVDDEDDVDDEEDELDEEELEDEDEEDSDEEEGPDEDAIREEVAGLNRTQLKAALKEFASDMKFKTSQTDDDLREMLVEFKLEEPPF